MAPLHPLQITALIVLSIAAAWYDLKSYRIPNAVTVPALLAGLAGHALVHGLSGLGHALAGAAAGFLVLGLFYFMGGMGAGDVKLMAAVGALLGWPLALAAIFCTAIAGSVLALGLMIRQWITAREGANRAGSSLLKVRLPYGVAIAAGTVWIIVRGVLP
ncbi:MAG TPA: A24 family peptidase [bacterium]|nr:A24 family peptidase [bacterium]HPR86841.1 A24 family peptidase [bacterium]